MPSTSELRQSDSVIGTVEDSVPIIDSTMMVSEDSASRREVVRSIRDACRNSGFFYIDQSDRERSVTAATLRQMSAFFALDDDDSRKQAVCRGDGDYGWMPKFSEPAYQPGTIANMEAFDCGLENIDGSSSVIVWPDLPAFDSDISSCWNSFAELGAVTFSRISEAAGMDRDFLRRKCDSQSLNTLRLLRYPASPDIVSEESVGISAHTDFECMTFICQTAPGLELTDISGNWFDAPTHDGRITVLLGDMLERWTNGRFKATGHRVRRTAEQRFSIVMFFAANDDMEIAPLPRFVSDSAPALYPVTTQAAHMRYEIDRARQNASQISEPSTAASGESRR